VGRERELKIIIGCLPLVLFLSQKGVPDLIRLWPGTPTIFFSALSLCQRKLQPDSNSICHRIGIGWTLTLWSDLRSY
jgi:hypothetical protein